MEKEVGVLVEKREKKITKRIKRKKKLAVAGPSSLRATF